MFITAIIAYSASLNSGFTGFAVVSVEDGAHRPLAFIVIVNAKHFAGFIALTATFPPFILGV